MSKAAKQSIYILIVLVILAVGFAVYSFLELKGTEEELVAVEQEFSHARGQFQAKEKIHAQNAKKLQDDLNKANTEKADALNRINAVEQKAKAQAKELTSQIDDIASERDKWKRRIDTIREERDQLMTKIDRLTRELQEASEERADLRQQPPTTTKMADRDGVDVSSAPVVLPDSGRVVDEQYWANLLQEKASLEIDIKKLNEELSKKSISIVELKQANEGLELEVDALRRQKEEIETKVQHTADTMDNISLELARTKNDKKFIANRLKKLHDENDSLRQEMKQLVSVKNALEKSIVRVTQEKNKAENQLGRTETLIQSKIDEIWEIKDELDQSIRKTQGKATTNEVELPPIVVSSSGQSESFNTGESAPAFNGQVISVNESNNFVIVDIGENSGVRLGDNLSVYRDSKYIARLEVIQVRKDISAADLKDQWSKIKVGDVIR